MSEPITTRSIPSPRNGSETSLPQDISRQATLMSDQLSMFGPETSPDTRSVISSPALAGGPTLSGLQDGPTISPSGPDRVRANRSRSRASKRASPTNATSGLNGFGSLATGALQRSLESRLRARSFGSTKFSMIWKQKVTPAGRLYCQLAPSMPRTSGIACGLLPTPQARDHFPAHTAEYVATKRAAGHGMANLNDFVAHEHLGLWPTPTASRRSGLQSHGVNAIHGVLNPQWVAWLMGYPINWLSPLYDVSATPSSRKSRRSSSLQQRKPSTRPPHDRI